MDSILIHTAYHTHCYSLPRPLRYATENPARIKRSMSFRMQILAHILETLNGGKGFRARMVTYMAWILDFGYT